MYISGDRENWTIMDEIENSLWDSATFVFLNIFVSYFIFWQDPLISLKNYVEGLVLQSTQRNIEVLMEFSFFMSKSSPKYVLFLSWIGILLPKLFWPTMRKKCSSDLKKITRTIYSNSESSEKFLVTECFFNLFLEVSHI